MENTQAGAARAILNLHSRDADENQLAYLVSEDDRECWSAILSVNRQSRRNQSESEDIDASDAALLRFAGRERQSAEELAARIGAAAEEINTDESSAAVPGPNYFFGRLQVK